MAQMQRQIDEMVTAIFSNRQASELQAATREFSAVQADHSRRNMINSGMYVQSISKVYESAVIRTVENTLEELYLQFRQAGRRDSTLFWNLVEPKIRDLGSWI